MQMFISYHAIKKITFVIKLKVGVAHLLKKQCSHFPVQKALWDFVQSALHN